MTDRLASWLTHLAALALLASAPGCGPNDAAAPSMPTTPPLTAAPPQLTPVPHAPAARASFVADPGPEPGAEAYLCQVIEVEGLDGAAAWVRGVEVALPGGAVALHHVSLFAARGDTPLGPTPCDPMPERVAALGVYTPGSVPLTLPDDTAIAFPPGTLRLALLAHALRLDLGPAQPALVKLSLAEKKPEKSANWVDIFAPVPVLFPHRTESSTGTCRLATQAHVLTVWPHMHLRGKSFTGTIVRASGLREPLVSIDSWDFNHQPISPVSVDLAPGDAIEARCTWSNDSDETILPGPFTHDEMCTLGLFVTPFEAARCAP